MKTHLMENENIPERKVKSGTFQVWNSTEKSLNSKIMMFKIVISSQYTQSVILRIKWRRDFAFPCVLNNPVPYQLNRNKTMNKLEFFSPQISQFLSKPKWRGKPKCKSLEYTKDIGISKFLSGINLSFKIYKTLRILYC